MTVIEMHRSFLSKTKSLDREDIRGLASYDIVVFLNECTNMPLG